MITLCKEKKWERIIKNKQDPLEKFTHALCEFLDSVKDMPFDTQLQFSIDVNKVSHGSYQLKNPMINEKKGLIIGSYLH